MTRDPALVYLARLFRGTAQDGLKRPGDARASYQSALEIGRGAHSATMALATSFFLEGRRDCAHAIKRVCVQHGLGLFRMS